MTKQYTQIINNLNDQVNYMLGLQDNKNSIDAVIIVEKLVVSAINKSLISNSYTVIKILDCISTLKQLRITSRFTNPYVRGYLGMLIRDIEDTIESDYPLFKCIIFDN